MDVSVLCCSDAAVLLPASRWKVVQTCRCVSAATLYVGLHTEWITLVTARLYPVLIVRTTSNSFQISSLFSANGLQQFAISYREQGTPNHEIIFSIIPGC
jgi:hypothetical protein